jgi:DNA-directed RNA polymerase subunit RPC12/RpoP
MPESGWTPVEVEVSKTKSFVTEDGRVFQDCELTISPDMAAELHAGYRCARCLEPLQKLGAFPERCPVCQFEVAKYQRQQLEEQYRGVDTSIVTPGFPLEREREHLERTLYRPKGLVTMSIPKKKGRS